MFIETFESCRPVAIYESWLISQFASGSLRKVESTVSNVIFATFWIFLKEQSRCYNMLFARGRANS